MKDGVSSCFCICGTFPNSKWIENGSPAKLEEKHSLHTKAEKQTFTHSNLISSAFCCRNVKSPQRKVEANSTSFSDIYSFPPQHGWKYPLF